MHDIVVWGERGKEGTDKMGMLRFYTISFISAKYYKK